MIGLVLSSLYLHRFIISPGTRRSSLADYQTICSLSSCGIEVTFTLLVPAKPPSFLPLLEKKTKHLLRKDRDFNSSLGNGTRPHLPDSVTTITVRCGLLPLIVAILSLLSPALPMLKASPYSASEFPSPSSSSQRLHHRRINAHPSLSSRNYHPSSYAHSRPRTDGALDGSTLIFGNPPI